ncbi:alpha/beta hydrolase [Streptomyces meridianus]|uniref:Alpha/beta hydrolase n=1 Tax=Streptomyces meridianus TaxID=2938945 RepID=A0ABT0X9Z7_9ACTN|nr:alpha/beta hydrolase [Streptomyces meridianus]MCM2579120.1 alpha/beta hydrolase [Streptomyces meridianus]
MRRVLLPLLGAFLAVTGLLSAAPAQPAHAAETPTTHSYGGHARQTLDAYWTPSTGAPKPALILIHGGYWYAQTDWSTRAQDFADQGFQVFAIKYRLNFEAAWPAQRDDVAAATAWVRQHAAEFDADPERVVMLGSSAGGQLATDAATNGTNALDLKGIVALSPVASPYRAWVDGNASTEFKRRKVRDNASILARCYPDSTDTSEAMHASCWGTWRSMVSKNWANAGDAPMYLLHSEDDFVPATHSTDLEATAEKNGVPAGDITTRIVTGSAHGGALLSQGTEFDRIVSWLKAKA